MSGLRQQQRYTDDPSNDFRRSTDDTRNMPWQVKAITFFGVPSAIACYLVYMSAGTHASDVQKTNELLQTHIQISTQLEQRTEQQNIRLEKILLALCVNSATTPVDRERCLR